MVHGHPQQSDARATDQARCAAQAAGGVPAAWRRAKPAVGIVPVPLNRIRMMLRRIALLITLAAPLGGRLAAQHASGDSSLLTVDRIFASPEFRAGTFGPLGWLNDGGGYTTLEPAVGNKRGKDIVRYDI